jgi:hypothetical protein
VIQWPITPDPLTSSPTRQIASLAAPSSVLNPVSIVAGVSRAMAVSLLSGAALPRELRVVKSIDWSLNCGGVQEVEVAVLPCGRGRCHITGNLSVSF